MRGDAHQQSSHAGHSSFAASTRKQLPLLSLLGNHSFGMFFFFFFLLLTHILHRADLPGQPKLCIPAQITSPSLRISASCLPAKQLLKCLLQPLFPQTPCRTTHISILSSVGKEWVCKGMGTTSNMQRKRCRKSGEQ